MEGIPQGTGTVGVCIWDWEDPLLGPWDSELDYHSRLL